MVATFNNHIRVVSDGKVYVRNDRDSAIAAFLQSLPPISACDKNNVRLFKVPENYPNLKEFDNDNAFPDVQTADPNFIWDSANQVSGEKLGFATGFEQEVVENNIVDFVVFLQAFADNAHNALISIYDRATLQKLFDVTPLLQDGDMDPSTGLSETQPPFGWQTVRYYSNTFTLRQTQGQTNLFLIVLSFEVQNYVHPNNPPFNPAALAFVADFYHQTRFGDNPAFTAAISLVSDENVVVRENRNQAIDEVVTALLSANPLPSNAVNLTSVPSNYPLQKNYLNNDSFSSEPNFIWDSSTQTSGDRKIFVTGFLWTPVAASDLVIFLQAFSDNAFNLRISVFDADKKFLGTVTPSSDLTDGDPNPMTGVISDVQPPYGWQNIRYYANNFLPHLTGLDSVLPLVVVLSFEVTNYVVPTASATNPAALSFVAHFYHMLAHP